MKLQKVIFILLLFTFCEISFAQKAEEDLILRDSFSEFNCEDLLARLDGFAIEIYKNPESVGYIVINDDSNAIKNKFLEQYITNYVLFRKFNKNQFVIIPAIKNEHKIELWISRDGKTKPNKKPHNFTFDLSKTEEPITFVIDTVEITKIDGKLTYFGDCSACCIETINLNLLSEFLKSNPKLNAHIKIYSNKQKQAKRLEKLIVDDAKNVYEIALNRLKFSYGGINEGIAQLGNNIASVEIELVPSK